VTVFDADIFGAGALKAWSVTKKRARRFVAILTQERSSVIEG
jgi:hypothetical protein